MIAAPRLPQKQFAKKGCRDPSFTMSSGDRVTGAWKQICQQRRRDNVSYDSSMVMALRHGTL